MSENVRYIILPEYRLIIEKFTGKINVDDILFAKKNKNEMQNFNSSFDHLIDLRSSILDVNHFDIEKIRLFQEKNAHYIEKRKSAFLTASPEHASLTTLFTMSMKDFPISFEIFTTLRAALNWLDLWDLSELKFKEFIIGK